MGSAPTSRREKQAVTQSPSSSSTFRDRVSPADRVHNTWSVLKIKWHISHAQKHLPPGPHQTTPHCQAVMIAFVGVHLGPRQASELAPDVATYLDEPFGTTSNFVQLQHNCILRCPIDDG
jgi:hypothetical protein